MSGPWDTPPTEDEIRQPAGAWDAPPTEREIAVAAQAPSVSRLEATGRGALQGATLGFGDEIAGGMTAAIQGAVNVLPQSVADRLGLAQTSAGDAYRFSRDEERAANDAARQAHGGLYTVGELAGSFAVPLPGSAALKGGSALAKVGKATALGAGVGAAYGLGSSEAHDIGGMAKDTLRGGAWGAGGGLVAGALGVGLDKMRMRAQLGVKAAEQAEKAIQSGKADKAIASKLGEYRSAVQSASRDLEVLERAAEGAGELAEQAKAFLATPEAQQMRDMVVRGKLSTAPERIGEATALKAEHTALSAGREGTIARGTEEALASPLKTQVMPRVKTWANRSIPVAVGTAVGGVPGAAVGNMVANTIGRPATAMAKMLQSPSVRRMEWSALEKILSSSPERLGKYAHPLQRAAERGTEAVAAAHYVLAQRDPEYRKMVKELEGQQAHADAR